MPVGAIIIWAGDQSDVPFNWRVCNGKSLKKTDYATLYSVLGENWVTDVGFHTDFFNIPDLRGVFLRGVNDERSDSFRDPDIEQRVKLKGDSTLSKDLPGSYQTCMIQTHAHTMTSGGGSSGPRSALSIDTHAEQERGSSATGGNETRPVNAYVYFIIKVKESIA